MLTPDQNQQFSDILEEFGKSLDITKSQHEKVVQSYEFVGNHLAAYDSPLYRYNPEILPQGSFMLGTMVRPFKKEDMDIDLVCRLEGKGATWTQKDLKKIVGDRLKAHGTLVKLLRIPDGRRCWTMDYAESAKFHMDVLPAIVSSNYRVILEKALSSRELIDPEPLAIRITDKELKNYTTSTTPEDWLKSNPFGYGIWFEQQATLNFTKAILMNEAVQPVPKYQEEKLPLQRVVQLLKRHRDMMFNGDDNKPISIIITTLAARVYRKETNIIDALVNVINRMPDAIQEIYSPEHRRMIKWIGNPVNNEENFADKWPECKEKQDNFYDWMKQVRLDVNLAISKKDSGLPFVVESLKRPFGEMDIMKAYDNYGQKHRLLRENGNLKMAGATGLLGALGTTVKNHNFHGKH